MKIMTKILLLLLSLTALVGVLVFTVSADGTEVSGFKVEYTLDGGSTVSEAVVESNDLNVIWDDKTLPFADCVSVNGNRKYISSGGATASSARLISITLLGEGESYTKPYMTISRNAVFTLNLNGNTAVVTERFEVAQSGSVDNNGTALYINGADANGNKGTITTVGGKAGVQMFQLRPGTTLVVDNVIIDHKLGGGNLNYDASPRLVAYKNCVIDTKSSINITPSGYYTATRPAYVFDSTEFISSGPLVIQAVGGNKYTKTNGKFSAVNPEPNNFDVYLLGDTKIDITASTATFVQHANATININYGLYWVSGVQNLYVEAGVKLPNASFNIAPNTVANTDNNILATDATLLPEGANLSDYILWTGAQGSVTAYDIDHVNDYSTYNDDYTYTTHFLERIDFSYETSTAALGDNMSLASFVPSEDDVEYPYMLANFEMTDDVTLLATTPDDSFVIDSLKGSTLPVSKLTSFLGGSKVTLYSDIEIVNDTGTDRIAGFATDLTFNLEGHSLTNSTGRFQIAGQKITFNNGNLHFGYTSNAFFFGGSEAGSEVNLTNVNLTSDGYGLQVYGGTWNLDNCTVTAANNAIGISDMTKSPLNITVKNSTLTSVNSTFTNTAKSGSSADILLDNCVISSGAKLLSVTGEETDGTLNITVKNSTVDTADTPFTNLYTSAVVTLDNSTFNNEPTLTVGILDCEGAQTVAKVEDGETLSYKVMTPVFNIRAALTLYSNFEINFYLPLDTTVSELTIGDAHYLVSEHTDIENLGDESYYHFTVSGISADAAADKINMYAVYTVDGVKLSQSAGYSVAGYFKTVLKSDTEPEAAKVLVSAAARYVNLAYKYVKKQTPDNLNAILASEEYSTYLPSVSRPVTSEDIGAAKAAISGATMNLSSSFNFRVNLSETYTGTLTFTVYKPDGETVRSQLLYNIENGKTEGENSYIDLPMRAHELYDDVIYITGSGFEGQGAYSLSTYITEITNANSSDSALRNLLRAMFAYCKFADEYNAIYG